MCTTLQLRPVSGIVVGLVWVGLLLWPVGGGATSDVVGSPGRQTTGVDALDQTLRPLAVTQLDEGRDAGQLDGELTSVTTFAEPLPLEALLGFLLTGTGLQVSFEPGVEGTFDGELKDVTLRQALDQILHPLGLDYDVRGTTIRVLRPELDRRLFDLDELVGGPVRVTTVEGGDAITELSTSLETLLSPDGRLRLDRRAALLEVSDSPPQLARVERYIEAVRTQRHRQVRIQAQVYQLEVSEEFRDGPDWSRVLDRAGAAVGLLQPPTTFGGGGTCLGVQIVDSDDFLRALRGQGRLNELVETSGVGVSDQPLALTVAGSGEARLAPGRAPAGAEDDLTVELLPQISAGGSISVTLGPSSGGEDAASPGTLLQLGRNGSAVVSNPVTGALARRRSRSFFSRLGSILKRGPKPSGRTDVVVVLTPVRLTPAEVASNTAPAPGSVGDLGDSTR